VASVDVTPARHAAVTSAAATNVRISGCISPPQ
jgi:hypothetical protein